MVLTEMVGEMFIEYQNEVYARGVLADSRGAFLTFSVEDRGIYIADIYVRPEARLKDVATDLFNRVVDMARELGLKHVYGTVDCTTKTWKQSAAAQKARGFREAAIKGSSLLLVYDVPEAS